MKIAHRLTIAFLLLGSSLFGQEESIRSAPAGEVFMIPEVSALLSAQNNTVKVEMAMPEQSRLKAYKNVDIKTGDEVLFLNGKRIKGIVDFTAIYDSLKTDEMVEIGLKRDEMRFIASFKKANPDDLPQGRMVTVRGDAGGNFTTSEVSAGGRRVAMEPNEFERDSDEIKPVMELGAIFGSKGKIVRLVRKLPIPVDGIAESALKEGDIIKSLNGKAITSLESFADQFSAIKVGEKIELQTERDGKSSSVSFAKPESRGHMMIRRDQN